MAPSEEAIDLKRKQFAVGQFSFSRVVPSETRSDAMSGPNFLAYSRTSGGGNLLVLYNTDFRLFESSLP